LTERRLIYRSRVSRVGERAGELMTGGLMVLFGEQAPEALAEFSVLHEHTGFAGVLRPGLVVAIGGEAYRVTAVGERAEQNLRLLGHFVLKFDGAGVPELPGHVHVHGDCPRAVNPGSWLEIYEDDPGQVGGPGA
jgi:PTS system glucitol/sorbitol-specific IIA component